MAMFERLRAQIRPHWVPVLCAGALGATAASLVAYAQDSKPARPEIRPLFSAPLSDVPGKNLVVVPLKWGPATKHARVDHTHPGSVYVYVTQGTVRLGVEGKPVQEVHTGESFFEPPGAVHTVAESA